MTGADPEPSCCATQDRIRALQARAVDQVVRELDPCGDAIDRPGGRRVVDRLREGLGRWDGVVPTGRGDRGSTCDGAEHRCDQHQEPAG